MKKLVFALAATLGLATGAAHAADIAAGKQIAEAQCAACHATNGDWNKPTAPAYPKLAGQHKDYLKVVLKHYQNGSRQNGIMNGIASTLSDSDINNVSAFFASLEGDLYLKK
ncbi:MAG: cytochrome c [Limnobacter sp.]|nr:cytochrome c [Limnobacter sp.]